jgi:ATP-dependent protease ClpP protease subunit
MSERNIPRAYLIGEINESSTKELLKSIDDIAGKKEIPKMELIVSSEGGKVPYAIAIYDHIIASQIPIDTIVEGPCMSAAVLVLQAGKRRISRPHSTFMIHPTLFVISPRESHDTAIEIVKQGTKYQDLLISLIARRVGISPSNFKKEFNPIKYFTAQEARQFGKHGLIDAIEEK